VGLLRLSSEFFRLYSYSIAQKEEFLMKKQVWLLVIFALIVLLTDCKPAKNAAQASGNSVASTAINPFITDENGLTLMDIELVAQAGQQQMHQMFGHLSDTMTFVVSVREESLVYTCNYHIEIEDTDALKSELEKNIGRMNGYYTDLSQSLYNFGYYDNSVIVEYFTKDGILIYSNEFSYRPINW
jgi:hypothetical protein